MAIDVTAAIKKELARATAEAQRWSQRATALRAALSALSSGKADGAPARKQRTMSAAERRKVSMRMKAYWEQRRAEKAAQKKR